MKILAGEPQISVLSGLETRFTDPAHKHTGPPPRHKKMFLTWWGNYPSVLVFSLLLEQHPYLLHPVVSLFRDSHCRTNSHLHIAAAIYPPPRIVVVCIRAACRSEVVIIAVSAIIQEPTWDQQRRTTHVASHSRFIVSNGS